MNDHILAEKIALAWVISSGIDWRDLYFNDLLRNFIHQILEIRGLENIISETFLEDLELLFAYAEIHQLSYEGNIHEKSFDILTRYKNGS